MKTNEQLARSHVDAVVVRKWIARVESKIGDKSAKLEQTWRCSYDAAEISFRGTADLSQIDVGIVRGLAYYTGIVLRCSIAAGN